MHLECIQQEFSFDLQSIYQTSVSLNFYFNDCGTQEAEDKTRTFGDEGSVERECFTGVPPIKLDPQSFQCKRELGINPCLPSEN